VKYNFFTLPKAVFLREIIWLHWLHADCDPTILRHDNTSAIQITNNQNKHELTKHIGVDVTFI
jgi:hypothetical protein